MGLFDTVHFTCPSCSKRLAYQSKADDGGSRYANYTLVDVPSVIIEELRERNDLHCPYCSRSLRFVPAAVVTVVAGVGLGISTGESQQECPECGLELCSCGMDNKAILW